MGVIGYVVFGGFLVGLLLVGVLFSKKQEDSSDFWVGGRSFGPLVLGIGITASIMHGGTLLSGVGLMASAGVNLLNNLSFAAGFFVVLVFLAKKLRRFGGYTIPDILGARFESEQVRLLSSLIVLIASIVTLIAQTKSMGIIVGQILGLPQEVAIVLSVVIFASYTIMGGMRGVIWTNIIQFAFMMLGVVVLAVAIFRDIGGMTAVMSLTGEVAPTVTSFYGAWGPMQFFSWHFVWFIAYFTRVEMVSKMYTARDERTAKWSLAIALAFLLLFINFTVYFSGAARLLVMDGLASSDQALPVLFTKMLSPAIASIALAGLTAAAMSTTDSLLLMAGSCISHDIMRKYVHERKGIVRDEAFYVKASRITILIVGIVTILGALNTPGLILVITSYAVALTGASFAAPMVLGLNWKRTSSSAAFASMLGGFLASGIWAIMSQMGLEFTRTVHPIIPGFVVSIILVVAVTLVTDRVSDATLEQFFPEKA